MPITSPDSIYYADGTTPASIATITAAVATSVQNAFNVRELRNYSWADATSRNAQTGMTTGEIGYQIDNDTFYIYDGSTWKIYAKQETEYVPTFTNLTPTSTSFAYSISGGIATVIGICTNSTTTTTGIRMTLPSGYNINTAYVQADTAEFISHLGAATYYDLSLTTDFAGFVSAYNATSVLFGRYVASTANLTSGAVGGSSNPFGAAWASGDLITTTFSYPVA